MDYKRFARVNLYDRETFEYCKMDDDNIKEPSDIEPYLTALVGILPSNIDRDSVKMRILDVISENPEKLLMGRVPTFGEIVVSDEDFVIENKVSNAEKHVCLKKDSEFVNLQALADWKILGSFFPERIGNETGVFKALDEKEWIVGKKDGVTSIETAQKWLLEHHPDYYMGMATSKQCPSGDLLMSAVPSAGNYPDGMWETWNNRRQYAKSEAERLNCDLGAIEHDRDGKPITIIFGEEIYLTHDDCAGRVVFRVDSVDKHGEFTFLLVENEGGWFESESANKKYLFTEDEIGRYFSDIDNDHLHMYKGSSDGCEVASPSCSRSLLPKKEPKDSRSRLDLYKELEVTEPKPSTGIEIDF